MNKKMMIVGMLCLALVAMGKTVGLSKGGEVRIIELEGPINRERRHFLPEALKMRKRAERSSSSSGWTLRAGWFPPCAPW